MIGGSHFSERAQIQNKIHVTLILEIQTPNQGVTDA